MVDHHVPVLSVLKLQVLCGIKHFSALFGGSKTIQNSSPVAPRSAETCLAQGTCGRHGAPASAQQSGSRDFTSQLLGFQGDFLVMFTGNNS